MIGHIKEVRHSLRRHSDLLLLHLSAPKRLENTIFVSPWRANASISIQKQLKKRPLLQGPHLLHVLLPVEVSRILVEASNSSNRHLKPLKMSKKDGKRPSAGSRFTHSKRALSP